MNKESIEYNKVKEMFFENEMNIRIGFNENSLEKKEETVSLKLGNGKIIKYGGLKKNE